MQCLHTRLDVAGKDAIKINLFAASTDYLITQLNAQSDRQMSVDQLNSKALTQDDTNHFC